MGVKGICKEVVLLKEVERIIEKWQFPLFFQGNACPDITLIGLKITNSIGKFSGVV